MGKGMMRYGDIDILEISGYRKHEGLRITSLSYIGHITCII